MTREEFQALLRSWCHNDSADRDSFLEIKANIQFLEKLLYETYEPVLGGGHGSFPRRLAKWIGSAENEDDQKNLFLILKHLFFLAKEDINAAYLTAYSKNIMSWLMDKGNISAFSNNPENDLRDLLARTAYTEVTDSLSIGNFMRINNIQGIERYTWEQHINNWDPDEFKQRVLLADHIGIYQKDYLVILEDFVGSGSQMKKSLDHACSLDSDVNVLLCPLIICPLGAELARKLESEHDNLTYSPVLEIPADHFVYQNPTPSEHADYSRIRNSIINVHTKVSGTPDSWTQNYGPFGFCNMGAIFAKYDNCPDNSLPALHHKSDLGWEPLFFRSSRVV